jgi:hypothetical protein
LGTSPALFSRRHLAREHRRGKWICRGRIYAHGNRREELGALRWKRAECGA